MTPSQNSAVADGDKRAGPVVLLVLPSLSADDDAARDAVDIAAAVVRAGAAAVVASAGGPLVHELTRAGAEHIALPLDRRSLWSARANADHLRAAIADYQVDLIDVRGLWPARSVARALDRSEAALVTTVDGMPRTDNPVQRHFSAALVAGDRVIAGSSFVAGFLRDRFRFDQARLRTVRPGIEVGRFAADMVQPERVATLAREWRLPDGEPVVLLPAPLSSDRGPAVQGILAVAQALARLGAPPVHCVILATEPGNDGTQRALAAQIARLGLGGTVRLIDRCADRPAAYRLCDAVVVPVPAQAGPAARRAARAILEAQAAGRPVIAEDTGGAAELIEPGETGWLVPPGNVDLLAATLDLVLSLDAMERRAWTARAAASAARFTRAAMVAATLAVYHEVLSGAPAERRRVPRTAEPDAPAAAAESRETPATEGQAEAV